MNTIDSFTGKYFFLSNFCPIDIWPQGWPKSLPPFPTSEHLFQAYKVDVNSINDWLPEVEWIRTAPTPGEAKRRGRTTLLMRSDWDNIRIDVMRFVIEEKFCDPVFAQHLLDTDDAELIEGNTWGDRFWGCTWDKDFGWTGHNWLGTILMEERSKLAKKN